jgi:pilus assembly protein CpaC
MSFSWSWIACSDAVLATWLAASALVAPPAAQDETAATPQEVLALQVGRSRHYVAPWPVKGASLTNPAVADVQVPTPELILVSGQGPGTTDLFLWGESGETRSLRVEVEADLGSLAGALGTMFPGTDLRVQQSGGVLRLEGALRHAEQAQQLHAFLDAVGMQYVDMTRLPGVQQVQVQVRIAEVSRTAIRSLGFNGFGTGKDLFLGSTIGSAGGGPINPVNIGPPLGGNASGDTPFVFTQPVTVSPSVTLFGGIPSENLEFFFQALEEDQFLRILAEPSLIALSGEEASFLAGGEFPIPIVQGGITGSSSITIEYKEFGVGLRFRPIVLGEGGIRLHVASEVSDLTDVGAVEIQGFRVPSVVTRRADTTLELKSGQTFAMAGLLSEDTNAQVSRTPGLGSLPILGALFRSVRYTRGETELVILVTASLVEPLSEVVLPPLPGDDHVMPSDWELYTMGRIEGGMPDRLSPISARWYREIGFHELRGPGAWATHEEEPLRSPVRMRPPTPPTAPAPAIDPVASTAPSSAGGHADGLDR